MEVGAGTGALTGALLDSWPSARVLATDPSPEMLTVLARKLGVADGRLSTGCVDAARVEEVCHRPPDLIAAGLADPFLDVPNLRALRAICMAGTRLFVTVPSRRWAARERTERLGVPIDTTRFRLRDGMVVFTESLTYDEDELCTLLACADFSVEEVGAERSATIWSRPEVCWAVASAR